MTILAAMRYNFLPGAALDGCAFGVHHPPPHTHTHTHTRSRRGGEIEDRDYLNCGLGMIRIHVAREKVALTEKGALQYLGPTR